MASTDDYAEPGVPAFGPPLCAGSGNPVFIDIGFVPRCRVCGHTVRCDGLYNAERHVTGGEP